MHYRSVTRGLESTIARMDAELARFNLSMVEAKMDRDRKGGDGTVIDLPAWPRSKGLN
jgi:hypothetical protein